jgi:TonB family protein
MSRARIWALVTALAAVVAVLALVLGDSRWSLGRAVAEVLPGGGRPDTLPEMLNAEPPFRYPVSLYARKIQGNVTLRIFVDRDGRVRPESTRVEESSGYTSLDSAAVIGSQELRFAPAKRNGDSIAVSILFPVFFRHPQASPLPGDTVLKPR